MATQFRKGQRVLYCGPVLQFRGKVGVVHGVDSKGWTRVNFDNGLRVKCATVNLQDVSNG